MKLKKKGLYRTNKKAKVVGLSISDNGLQVDEYQTI